MKRLLTAFLLLALIGGAAKAQQEWGKTPDIHVEGNHLVNADGQQVMLHGIMDTPSPYFCNYRFTDNHWVDLYREGDNWKAKAVEYFDKIFTAATDTAQGSWCNVFRLHLDPCWTDNPNKKNPGFTESNGKVYDPNGTEVSGEASTYHFDMDRLNKFLGGVYLSIARKANAHGMYVILRPPGVCPSKIKVGDYYQQYLIDVWDKVTKHFYVQQNPGWLSIELANEPIAVLDKNGNRTDQAKRDFFQPIIDKIRANGFTGIIWVPGETWQQEYKSYVNYPCTDPLNNMGYAVHFYPGWYNTSDSSYDPVKTITSFQSSVPVVKTHPIMITEVDWSPEAPGTGHYNESGQWVVSNYGTWATGSTSKFGISYKAMLDYFGNVGMTLTHTHDYMEIDEYLKSGTLYPRWKNDKDKNYMEACSGACFEWYKKYASQVHLARDFTNQTTNNAELFPLKTTPTTTSAYVFNPSIIGTGSLSSSNKLTTSANGLGGWLYSDGFDMSHANYLIVQLLRPCTAGTKLEIYDNAELSNPYSIDMTRLSLPVIPLKDAKKQDGTTLDLTHICAIGFRTLGGDANAVYLTKLNISADGQSTLGISEHTLDSNAQPVATYSIDGMRQSSLGNGIRIVRMSNGSVIKVRN